MLLINLISKTFNFIRILVVNVILLYLLFNKLITSIKCNYKAMRQLEKIITIITILNLVLLSIRLSITITISNTNSNCNCYSNSYNTKYNK